MDSHLQYWPKFLVHKNKQRLTKITQYLIRMRRLALRPRTKLMTMPARSAGFPPSAAPFLRRTEWGTQGCTLWHEGVRWNVRVAGRHVRGTCLG